MFFEFEYRTSFQYRFGMGSIFMSGKHGIMFWISSRVSKFISDVNSTIFKRH